MNYFLLFLNNNKMNSKILKTDMTTVDLCLLRSRRSGKDPLKTNAPLFAASGRKELQVSQCPWLETGGSVSRSIPKVSACLLLKTQAALKMGISQQWWELLGLLCGAWLGMCTAPESTPAPTRQSQAGGTALQFRLAGYPRKPHEGRIEIFYRQEWGTICDDDFTLANAHVLCRHLGFVAATGWTHSAKYGTGVGEHSGAGACRCGGVREDCWRVGGSGTVSFFINCS